MEAGPGVEPGAMDYETINVAVTPPRIICLSSARAGGRAPAELKNLLIQKK